MGVQPIFSHKDIYLKEKKTNLDGRIVHVFTALGDLDIDVLQRLEQSFRSVDVVVGADLHIGRLLVADLGAIRQLKIQIYS